MAQSSFAEARRGDSAILVCFALAWAVFPVASLNGDLSAAEDAVSMLLDVSAKCGTGAYHAWGRRQEAMLLVKRGDEVGGATKLRAVLGEYRERRLMVSYTYDLCDLAEALGLAGQVVEGLAAIDEALERSEHEEERWCMAELLRVKGELMRLQGGDHWRPRHIDGRGAFCSVPRLGAAPSGSVLGTPDLDQRSQAAL